MQAQQLAKQQKEDAKRKDDEENEKLLSQLESLQED